jgi:hypothetical protein
MASVLQLSTSEAESALFARMLFIDRTERVSYAERGLICRAVQKFMLHEERTDPATGKPCSFSGWIRLASPWSYPRVFAAMRDVEELKDVPDADLAQIPEANLKTMKQLSTAVRADPSVLQAAKEMSNECFADKVRKDFPEQHLEVACSLHFTKVEESAAKVIEEAIDEAIKRGAHGRNEALEMVAATALEEFRLESEVEAIVSNPENQVSEPGVPQ